MCKRPGPVGVKDVARHAGLSPQTVSMVLNGRNAHLLRETTRQRCLDAARELGYAPNTAARAARTGRFGQLGLLVATSSDAGVLPTQLLHGMHDVLSGMDNTIAGMGLTVDFVDPDRLANGYPPRLLAERAVDALLVNYTHRVPTQLVETIARLGTPAIWVNALTPTDCVLPDERGAARLAVDHFRRTHRTATRYFSLTPWRGDLPAADPREAHFSARERWLGYIDAARQAEYEPALVEPSALAAYCGGLARRRREGGGAEALLTYKETDAVHALSIAKAHGLRLPDDLVIGTFASRSFLSAHVNREILTWIVPYRGVGSAAVRMALAKIERPDESRMPELVPYAVEPDAPLLPEYPAEAPVPRQAASTVALHPC